MKTASKLPIKIKRTPTPLTEEMIDSCPVVDTHAHVQGTITPYTAWELGIRNGFIRVEKQPDGTWQLKDGPNKIGKTDPAGTYSNIFCSEGGHPLRFDRSGKPVELAYNYYCVGDGHDKFSGFDAVMATVQGHRHPPGGIRTPDDYHFVLTRYLESCVSQKVRYTEVLQNIHIAHVLNPKLPPLEARAFFFRLCHTIVKEFAAKGVELRFQHCPNKTGKANLAGDLATRSREWPEWLKEAQKIAPHVFVGLNSAGHEEEEQKSGGPHAMQEAYTKASEAGFGCEAHAGEGVGVEHLLATIRALPVTCIAHGVQVIESAKAIGEIREAGITLKMMPCINIALGTPIHVKEVSGQPDVPHAKLLSDGTRNKSVVTKHIKDLSHHPFFALLREHKLPIALCTDNPGMGGEAYKHQVKILAGLEHTFPPAFKPLSAEELALCNMHAIHAAFCSPEIKRGLLKELSAWMQKYKIQVSR